MQKGEQTANIFLKPTQIQPKPAAKKSRKKVGRGKPGGSRHVGAEHAARNLERAAFGGWDKQECSSLLFTARVWRLGAMLFTYGPFSREAAQDRSPWVERSGTLGKNRRGVNPEGV